MEQPAASRFIRIRYAIVALASVLVAAKFVFGLVEIHETTHEEIQLPIIVVVEPHRTGCPARSRYTGLFGHVRERSVAIVAIENAAPVLAHV